MRNFEQRKAEVFRRSEERIHTRRKWRNCIMAFCIPLCLILVVWSAGLFPIIPGPAKNAGTNDPGYLVGNANSNNGQTNSNTPGNNAGNNDGLTGNTPGDGPVDSLPPTSGGNSNSGIDQDIPRRPHFDTLGEIKAFFTATPDLGEHATDSIKNYVDADKVADICSMADKMVFPTSEQAQFGSATYFEELQSLDIIYGYNDIQYRFIYYFDKDSVYESESSPALLDVQVGPYKVDFWKIDHSSFPYKYYGYVKIDGVYLVITGLGEDLSEFSLEVFNFVPLSSVE